MIFLECIGSRACLSAGIGIRRRAWFLFFVGERGEQQPFEGQRRKGMGKDFEKVG